MMTDRKTSKDRLQNAWNKTMRFVNPMRDCNWITKTVYGIIGYLTLRKLYDIIYRKWYKGLPPGPTGYPFIGCLIEFGMYPREFLISITMKYGSIVCVPIGVYNNIFINDYKLINQLFKNNSNIFNDRPLLHNSTRVINEFALINNNEWKKRRKFAFQSLFKMANNSTFIYQNVLNGLINDVIPQINDINNNNNNKNKLWYPSHHCSYLALISVFAATFGCTLNIDDKFINKYLEHEAVVFASLEDVLFVSMLINFKLPDYIMWEIISDHRKNENKFDQILIEWMNKSGYFTVDIDKNILKRNKYQFEQTENDKLSYIDFLINQFENDNITLPQIISDVQGTFSAGIDTTKNTAEYGFILLAKYPKIQQQVYMEIRNLIQSKQNMNDFNIEMVNDLPVFRAFINEVLRISTVVPLGLPHRCKQDFIVQVDDNKKYLIEKGNLVHINAWGINKYQDWNNGHTAFNNGKEFNDIHLEYWLDDNGKYINDNMVKLMAFGKGRRDCVGKTVAIKALQSIFGLLIVRYKFCLKHNIDDIKQLWGTVQVVDPPIGLLLTPRDKL